MRWSALQIALAIATVSSPIAVAYTAGRIADSSARRAANVELVKLSVGILQGTPTDSTRGLRRWAVDVLARYSEVPIPSALKSSLADSLRITLPETGFGPNDNPPSLARRPR
jgi:hypothetical protein